eukprot:1946841-Rhodomonas_salina.3
MGKKRGHVLSRGGSESSESSHGARRRQLGRRQRLLCRRRQTARREVRTWRSPNKDFKSEVLDLGMSLEHVSAWFRGLDFALTRRDLEQPRLGHAVAPPAADCAQILDAGIDSNLERWRSKLQEEE